jgi:hypothetical protein
VQAVRRHAVDANDRVVRGRAVPTTRVANPFSRRVRRTVSSIPFWIATLVIACAAGRNPTAINCSQPYTVHIKATGKPPIHTGCGDSENNELWIKQGTIQLCLVASQGNGDPKKVIAAIKNPVISPDRTKIFFQSAAWVTSGSIHVFDLKTWTERFVCAGNGLEVIASGKYAENLLVLQHRYNPPPEFGSYDHY